MSCTKIVMNIYTRYSKASDNEDVASALTKVYNDRKLSSDMGEKSKKWFDKYVVGEGLMKIINAIESEYQTHNS